MNRLADETSPYLLQHADNPVDWFPWGDEAFAKARSEDKPVLLSVGYSACHWCHVMAHESFENPEVAALLNAHFVPVKVDREERPDVDAVYMQATQAMTGHGGWPMTVFLTPDRRPFYAGTYFPPSPRHGLPSFAQLLEAISSAWRDQRTEVVESAVTIPLEQELNGVEGMRYITSTSSNDGTSQITITFEPTRDIEVAAVDVQNRVSRAAARFAREQPPVAVVDPAEVQLLREIRDELRAGRS